MDAARGGLSSGSRSAFRLAFAVLLVLGMGLRLLGLDRPALFIDEAESGINALTILERGWPADRYLGLPMFENTLTEPWPESEEYEFRDTSYVNGKAVYHGWLPLYAMAASLTLHGIRPDVPLDPPRVLHDEDAVRTRIRAIRLPSVLFGGLLLVTVFLLGRRLFGPDAGLAAMAAVALAPKCVWLAQEARYYSAGLALSALAALCAWQVAQRGRWRDFFAAGLAFVLLFHTYSVLFLVLLVPCAGLLPAALRHPRGASKLASAALVVTLGLLPWMLWTGYLDNLGRIPMARASLAFPGDYLVYLRGREGRVGLFAALTLGLTLAWFRRRRLPPRLAGPLERAAGPLLFLAVWIVTAFFGFQALIPSASCTMSRLSHLLIVAPALMAAIVLAGLARALAHRATVLPAAALLGAMAASGDLFHREGTNPFESRAAFALIDTLRGLELERGARVYALPYQHFCLAFCTGMPVQSIAPVRADFLSRYPGEVVILETTPRLPHPRWERVRELARAQGVELPAEADEPWVQRLQTEMIRSELAPLVHECLPEPGPLPPWVAPVVAALVREAGTPGPGPGRFDFAADNPAMFAGQEPMPIDDFWTRFFYCYVDPAARSGAHLNYARRMREASALVLPTSWVVLRCPARRSGP